PSVRSCCKRRLRPAPMARRTVISWRRAKERTRSRLPTLAQAMSRTKTTTATMISSVGPLGAQLFSVVAGVEIAVDEIGDNVDGALDVEFLERLRQQVLRDGGDAVALLDGKTRNRGIAAVAAGERNVGAMVGGE